MTAIYENDSDEKNLVRKHWIEFSKASFNRSPNDFKLLTMPSEEMQDIEYYKKSGLIKLYETETGAFRANKGHLVCYEEKMDKYIKISKTLTCEEVYNNEICKDLITRPTRFFPFDTINLDFDHSLEKSLSEPQKLFDSIFSKQMTYKINFSLFLTFPENFEDYSDRYKAILKNVIDANLREPYNDKFKHQYKLLGNVTNEDLCKIAISKEIIRSAFHNNYKISKIELFAYGRNGGAHRRMLSFLYNFNFQPQRPPHSDYFSEVLHSLKELKDLTS